MPKFKLSLAIYVLFALVLLITSCNTGPGNGTSGNPDEECTHEFGKWEVVLDSTCTQKGKHVRVCSLCMYIESGDIDLKAHAEEIDQAIEPTCTETGLTEGTHCSVCKTVLKAQETVKETGHKYTEGVCHCGANDPYYVPENNDPQFVMSSENAKCGDIIEITVALKNNPGIASIILSVVFDNNSLTLTEVLYNTSVGGETVQPQNMNSPIKLYWINGFADAEGDFVLATLKFTVKNDATLGDHNITLSYNADDVYDISETNLPFEIVNGKITVEE